MARPYQLSELAHPDRRALTIRSALSRRIWSDWYRRRRAGHPSRARRSRGDRRRDRRADRGRATVAASRAAVPARLPRRPEPVDRRTRTWPGCPPPSELDLSDLVIVMMDEYVDRSTDEGFRAGRSRAAALVPPVRPGGDPRPTSTPAGRSGLRIPADRALAAGPGRSGRATTSGSRTPAVSTCSCWPPAPATATWRSTRPGTEAASRTRVVALPDVHPAGQPGDLPDLRRRPRRGPEARGHRRHRDHPGALGRGRDDRCTAPTRSWPPGGCPPPTATNPTGRRPCWPSAGRRSSVTVRPRRRGTSRSR